MPSRIDGAPPAPPAAGPTAGVGSMSLQRRLPLLIMVLLALILTLSLGVTYAVLSRQAEDTAHDRLAGAAREVAASAGGVAAERLAALVAFSELPQVRALFTGGAPPDSASLGALRELAEDRLTTAGDPSVLELWDVGGRRVAGYGGTHPEAVRPAPPVEGGIGMSAIYLAAGGAHSWTVAPVRESGATVGYLAWRLRIGGPASAEQMVEEMTGRPVDLYLRNADGSVWSRHPGHPADPPDGGRPNGEWVEYRWAGQPSMLAAEAPIPGGGASVVVGTPLSQVDASARATTAALALASLLLLALGTAGAWLLSRRVIHPLQGLTAAAEDLAAGQFSRRVDGSGDDEVGRLARAFNQMAAEIEASRRELIQRIDQANEARVEAQEARAQAERASRAKSDFLAVMSHELRTPLNAIAGYVDLLRLGVHGPVTEPQEEALRRIVRSQEHLLHLIHDVLNYVKLDADKVQYAIADVPLDRTLAEMEAFLTPQILAARLRLELEHPAPAVTVRADADKLQQILLNLLSNAVKFTGPHGTIWVGCEVYEKTVRVRVEDTGIGIAPDRLAAVFDPFFQADRALNRPAEGVGLGLTISRDLARDMGGDLTVESVIGKGSVFTLELPRGADARPDAPDGEPSRARATSA